MISGVILTKNEEKNIIDCIDSISFCDEIVIVDDYSEDRTVQLVERLNNPKIKVAQRHLHGNFAAQRNAAVEKTSQPWILFVDADERVSDRLQLEIIRAVENERHIAYQLKRIDHVWNTTLRYGEIRDLRLVRLARRDTGKGAWEGKVHEVWNIKGLIGELEDPLDHYPHQKYSEFLAEINTYSSLRAEELADQKKVTNLLEIVGYPKLKFLRNYLLKQGYKDGTAGFVFAMTMSFHSFLVRSKLYFYNRTR